MGPLDILMKLYSEWLGGEDEMNLASQATATGPCHSGGASWGLAPLESLEAPDPIYRERDPGKRLLDWQLPGLCR